MQTRSRLTTVGVMLVAVMIGACGGGDGEYGPDPLPTPTSPAAGTLGDERLVELIEWARDAQEVPAMGVIIIRGGRVVERAAVGLRSAGSGVPVTADDQWHMGSITKSMTATLAALLVEDGLISWDSTPLDVWPEQAGGIDAGFRHVTLRQNLRWFALTWFSPDEDAGLLLVLNGAGERGQAAVSALDLLLRQRIAASP